MEDIKKLWDEYNHYANKLSKALGRTSNIVGEYAEYLTFKYYGGELLPSSHPSADLKGKNNELYQVKARKLKQPTQATQLGIIRSWKFDFLIVILFHQDGSIYKAIEVSVETAQKHAKENSYQKGWVITTNQEFLTDGSSKDITTMLVPCHNCHKKYDAPRVPQPIQEDENPNDPHNPPSSILPITLEPSDPDIFKQELLISKQAEIETTYSDDRIKQKIWNADRFNKSSNVLGNLRSRPEFRSGKWQSRGIVKVHVKVIKNA